MRVTDRIPRVRAGATCDRVPLRLERSALARRALPFLLLWLCGAGCHVGSIDCGPKDTDGDRDPDHSDCAPLDATIHRGAAEVCNTIDDDCDGLVDEGTGAYYGRDPDGDSYPSDVVHLCGPPEEASYRVVDADAERDCAPDDPTIHPNVPDDCDGVDRNCDGVFWPVTVVESDDSGDARSTWIETELVTSRDTDHPVPIAIEPGRGVAVYLCPGEYRVTLTIEGYADPARDRISVVGLGDDPADVVLDAGGERSVVSVEVPYGAPTSGALPVTVSNLTLRDGSSGANGGCLSLSSGGVAGPTPVSVTLTDLVFERCTATRGGALASTAIHAVELDRVTFRDCTASVAGGAVYVDDGDVRIHRSGFVSTSAPTGAAIEARLIRSASRLVLDDVALASIADDVSVLVGAIEVTRDLGDGASLVCSSSGCDP